MPPSAPAATKSSARPTPKSAFPKWREASDQPYMNWLTRDRVGLGGRLELHRFAAAAGGCLVRIVEYELRGEFVGLVVHFGAEQEQDRLGIDEDAHALVLDN